MGGGREGEEGAVAVAVMPEEARSPISTTKTRDWMLSDCTLNFPNGPRIRLHYQALYYMRKLKPE